MIPAFCRLFAYLAIGDLISRCSPFALPGPVIALVILFVDLCLTGRTPEALATIAERMIQAFGLFFVPAGVGVVAHMRIIQADYLAIGLALTVGTLVTIAATAFGAALIAAASRARGEISTCQSMDRPRS